MTAVVDGCEVRRRAERLADEVLFPAALATDAAERVPAANLDALAQAGLYGVAAELDREDFSAVVEALASGCLSTTFVWLQHHGLVKALAGSEERAEMDARARRGEVRGGLALAGLLPHPPLRCRQTGGDAWVVDGSAPWVTGWGMVDLLLVAARSDDGTTVTTMLVDAVEGGGLSVERQRLVAVDASTTVEVTFDGVVVSAHRALGSRTFQTEDPAGLRTNGSLALGVANRCCRLLGASPLDDELAAARATLDGCPPEAMPAARAAAAELAQRAAVALVVHEGSRSITTASHAQRLAREAMFLLVFGSRPSIKAELGALLVDRRRR